MNIRRVPWHFFCALLLIGMVLGGCADREAPPPTSPVSLPPAAPPVPEPAPDDALIEARIDRFCRDIGRIIDAEPQGYRPLRGPELGQRSWRAQLVPDGLANCRIEGPRHPIAAYECRTQAVPGTHAGLFDQAFAQTVADLDQCFARPTWYPKEWRRGRVISFGRGEKQISWRDVTASPKPVVSLAIEEDFANRVHYLRLAVTTLN